MSKSKIIINGKEFDLPQELVDRIKNEVSSKSVKEKIYEILNENFNGCETELSNGIIYFKKNGSYLFRQDLKNQYFYINYYKIWIVFYDNFGLKYNDVQAITKDWVGDTLNLKGYTTPVIVV
jgi:hypothetical protein